MKQTNNAIKFLMAQYRAIFKNANIAMLAAIAASALAAGQAQAATTDWTAVSGDTAINDTDTFTVSGDGAKVNKNGFNVTISSGDAHVIKGNTAHGVFTVAEGKKGSLTINASAGDAGATKLVVGSATAVNTAEVTITKLTNTKGTLEIEGNAADAGKFSALNATTINIGVDSANANEAIVNVKGHGSLNASDTLEIGKGGKVTVAENGAITAGTLNMSSGSLTTSGKVDGTTININGGTVDFGAAAGVLGSDTSVINISGGTVHAKTAAGTVKGTTVNLKSGDIKATDDLTIDGSLVATSGTLTIKNQKALILKGADSSIGDDVKVVLDTDTDTHTLRVATDANKSSKLSLSVKKFNEFTAKGTAKNKIALSGAASSKSTELRFTDAKVDLGAADVAILSAKGQLNDAKIAIEGTDTVAKISGIEGVFTAGDALDAQNKKLTLAFETLTIGSGDTVTLNSGAGVEASKLLTVGSGATKATLKVVKGGVTLNGAGRVDAKTINLEGSAASDAELKVSNGAWAVKDLSLTKGKATVAKEGQLTVTGTLLGKADSTMTVNGVLSTVGDGKLNFKEAADDSLKVEAGGTLKVDAGDILTANKKLDTNALKAAALSGAGVVNVVAAKNYTMTQDEFREFRDLLSGSFTGTFNMDFVQVEVPKEQVITTTQIEGQLATQAYNEKTLKTNDQGISGNYSVGNIYVDAKSDLNLKGGKAGLVLNNASNGPGAGYFVSKNSGSQVVAGGVVFDTESTNLTLVGEGKIGSISTDSGNKGVVVIGIADDKAPKAGHVTVVAGSNIGTYATQGVTNVLLNEGSSLTVESGSVFTNSFNMQEGTSVRVTGDITTGALQVLGNSLTANKLIISDAGKAAENTIAGGANVTLTELSLGKNNALFVGESGDGTPENLGSSAKVYTGSLKMNATGSSIFVDPNYGTGASLFATDNIGDNGSTVSGKVGIGSNSAFGVGFASMAEFEETLSPYLTNNGGFDGEGAVKNALVLNKPVTIGADQGITVDSELKATDYDTKVSGNALTLGAGAALIVTNEALAADGAVKFANGAGKVNAAADKSSLVIFAADVTKQDSGKKVFGTGTTVDQNLVGQAAGGLLDVAFNADGTITLTSNDKRLGEMRQHISEPTTQLFADYRDGKFAGAVGSLGYKFVYESLTAPGDAYKAVDIAAHAATYAGAQQAAVAAVTTMADAMFGRVGAVGVEAATIAATGSQANGGVWLTPMYKSVDSEGFGAQGGSYGADVDLSGVAFGTDTVNGNMRFGAVFNIGSGDTEGKGLGNGLKDEFDYYGFGIYSAMGFGNFALVGDASMTVISHEVEGLGLKGKADTTAVTMGLTGQYTVATPMVDVTPHLGARFIRRTPTAMI